MVILITDKRYFPHINTLPLGGWTAKWLQIQFVDFPLLGHYGIDFQFITQTLGEEDGGLRLTHSHKNFFERAGARFDESDQRVGIGMSGEAMNDFHFGFDSDPAAVDDYLFHPFFNLPAQSAGRLIAGEDDGGVGVGQKHFFVCENPATRGHPGAGNNDFGTRHFGNLSRVADRGGLFQFGEFENIVSLALVFLAYGVVKIFDLLVNLGDADGQRRVEKDRYGRQPAGFKKIVELVENDLRAFERKGRNENGAAALDAVGDGLFEFQIALRLALMVPVAVDTLHKKIIKAGNLFHIRQDGRRRIADIPGEEHAPAAWAGQFKHSRTQYVAGVVKLQFESCLAGRQVTEITRLMIRERFPKPERIQRISGAIERLDAVAVNFGRVHEQECGNTFGLGGGINLATKAFFVEFWNKPEMVDVRGRDEEKIYFFRVIRKFFGILCFS